MKLRRTTFALAAAVLGLSAVSAPAQQIERRDEPPPGQPGEPGRPGPVQPDRPPQPPRSFPGGFIGRGGGVVAVPPTPARPGEGGGEGWVTLRARPDADGRPMTLTVQRARVDGKLEKGAFLGVHATAATPVLRRQLQLPDGVGLVVEFIEPGSPAGQAGVEQYDVLHKLNEQVLVNGEQLAVLVRTFKAGEEVKLTLVRDGKPTTLTAKLAEKDLPPLPQVLDLQQNELRLRGFLPARPGQPPAPTRARPAPPARPPAVNAPDPRQQEEAEVIRRMRERRQQVARQEDSGGEGESRQEVEIRRSDRQHTLTLSVRDGRRHLTAQDASGKTLYDGPIDTEEQLKALPSDVRLKLDQMQAEVGERLGEEKGVR